MGSNKVESSSFVLQEIEDLKERLKRAFTGLNEDFTNAVLGIIGNDEKGVDNEKIEKLIQSVVEIKKDVEEREDLKTELDAERAAYSELEAKMVRSTESYVAFRRAYNDHEGLLKKMLHEKDKEMEKIRSLIEDKERLVVEVEECYQNATKENEILEKSNKELQDHIQKSIFKLKKSSADYDGKIARLETIIKDIELFKMRLGSKKSAEGVGTATSSLNDIENTEVPKPVETEVESAPVTQEANLINATKDIDNEDVKNMIGALYTEISHKNGIIYELKQDRKVYKDKISELFYKQLEIEQMNNKKTDELNKVICRNNNDINDLNQENEKLIRLKVENEKRIEELEFQKEGLYEIIEDLNRARMNLEITLKGMESIHNSSNELEKGDTERGEKEDKNEESAENEKEDYLKVLKFENDTLIMQLSEFNNKVQELQLANEEMEELIKSMSEGYRNAKCSLAKVEEENNCLKTEKNGLKNAQISLYKERDELSIALRKQRAENQELTAEKEKYFQLYAQNEKKSKELDSKIKSCEGTISRLNIEKADLSKKIEEQNKEKEIFDKEKQALNTSLESARGENKKALEEKEQAVKNLSELQVQYVEMTKNRDELENDIAKLKSEHDELQATVDEMKKKQPKTNEANQDDGEARLLLENLRIEKQEILNDKINISRLYKELEDRVRLMAKENDDMKNFMEYTEGRKASMGVMLEKFNFAQKENEVFHSERNETIEIIKKVKNSILEVSRDNDHIEQLNKELENKLGVLELENIRSNSKIVQMQELLRELNKANDLLNGKVTELVDENNSVNENLSKMKDEMEDMGDTIVTLKSENNDLKIKLQVADEGASLTDQVLNEIQIVRCQMDNLITVKEDIIKDFETLRYENEELLNRAESLQNMEEEYQRGFELLRETKMNTKGRVYTSITKLNNLMKALGDTDTEKTSLPDSKDKDDHIEGAATHPGVEVSLVTSQIEQFLANSKSNDQVMNDFEKKKRDLHIGAETLKKIERELRMFNHKQGFKIYAEKPVKTDYTTGLQNYLNELTNKDLIDSNVFDLKNPDVAFNQIKFLNEKIAKLKGIINFLYETKFQDNKITKCSSCCKKFKFTSRRHQCKVCAQTFCHKCTNYKVRMPISKRSIRVCRNCVEIKEELVVE